MIVKFDREKMMKSRIGFLILIWMACCLSWAKSPNSVWIGNIRDIRIDQRDTQNISLAIMLQEYTTEGTFDEFDENKVVFINKNTGLTEWSIILDNIAIENPQQYAKEALAFCKSLNITQQKGSFADPNLIQTQQGKAITTSKIVVAGTTSIYLVLEKVDKNNPSSVSLFFKITDQIPSEQLTTVNKACMVEIAIKNFELDKPVGKFISHVKEEQLTPKTRQYFKQLQQLPVGTFVTMVYQSKYHDVNTLRKLLDHIKSELGEIEVLEATAQIMVRDRSEYVLDMLHLLTSVDIPVPQLVLDVQIIERNSEEGKAFSASFQYLREGSKNSSSTDAFTPNSQIPNSLKGDHISGIYRHLDDDSLNVFQLHINSEIMRAKARLKASTRIICKNREAAKFNCGSRIPYYQLNEFTADDRANYYKSQEQSETGTKSEASGQSWSTTDSSSKRNFVYDEKEAKQQHKWQIQFIETGVQLWFQPYIKNSEWVDLILRPSYSEITGWTTAYNTPILSNRSLDTTVTVKNGDTFLLAGLLYEKELKAIRGVPVLMDIPLLGSLFMSEISYKQQTEIIFVLTVYIYYPGA